MGGKVGPCKESYKEPTQICSLCFFGNFYTHELSLTGPPALELALDITSRPRYCIVYCTYYLSTV